MDYKSMHAVLWWMLFIFLIFVPGSTLNAIENSDITAAATKIPAIRRVPAAADERTTTKAPTQRRDAINDIIRLKPQATTVAAVTTTTTNTVSTISTAFSSTTEATATTTTTVNAATLTRNPASSSIFNESELSLNPSIKDRTTTATITTTTAAIVTTKSAVAEQVTIATPHLSLATSKELKFNQDDNKIVGSSNNSNNSSSDLKAGNKSRHEDSSNSSTNNADNVHNSEQQQQPIESLLKFASYDDINDSSNLNNRQHKLPAAQQLQQQRQQQQHQLQHYESHLRQHYTRQVQQAHVIIASAMTATTIAAAVPRDTNFMVAVAMSENELQAETQVKVFESVATVVTAREAATTIATTSAKVTTWPTITTPTFAAATAATTTTAATAAVTAAMTTTTPETQTRRTTRRRARPTTTPLPTPAIDDYATINSQAGTHAYLPCNVKQLVKKPISWLRVRDGHILTVDQTTFIADQRFQSIYTTNPERWSLQIKYVQLKDAGTYECQVSTEPKASAIVSLRIVEPKTELIGEPTRHVKAGSQVKLRCIISQALEPPLFINWFYNQKQIYLHNRKGWRTEIERIDLPPDTPAPPTPPPATTTQAPLLSPTLLPAAAATSSAASTMTVTPAMAAATSAGSDLALLSVSDANATASMLAAAAAATSTLLPAFASTNTKTTTASASAFTTQAATTTTEKATSMMTTTPLAVTDVKQITTASLIIPAVEKQDSGNYTCSPSNSAPRTVVLHVLNGEYSASAITSGVSGNILIGNKGQQRQQQQRHQRGVLGLGLGAAVALLCHNVPTILTLLWIIKFLLANNFWNFNRDRNKAMNGSSSSELEDKSGEITQFANSRSCSSGNNDNGGKHGTTGNPDTSIRATEIVEPRNMSARECGSNFLQLSSASE